jgi:hypothetical protein
MIVRSMGFAKGFTASFSALRSGEVGQYTEVLEDSRRHAVDRMIANAHVLGADAIIAVRFDSSRRCWVTCRASKPPLPLPSRAARAGGAAATARATGPVRTGCPRPSASWTPRPTG